MYEISNICSSGDLYFITICVFRKLKTSKLPSKKRGSASKKEKKGTQFLILSSKQEINKENIKRKITRHYAIPPAHSVWKDACFVPHSV